ncbi:MAG: hypothetical protein TECD_00480 [Hyphomicrobiaceae bacterium hypho_1]
MILINANLTALHNLVIEADFEGTYAGNKSKVDNFPNYIMSNMRKNLETSIWYDLGVTNYLETLQFHLLEIQISGITELKKRAGLIVGFNVSDGD